MLYKWDTAQRRAWDRWLCPKHSLRTHPGSTRLCTGHRFYRLEIQLRDLVLRAHEHGTGWGLPLSVLQQSCRERWAGGKKALMMTFDAKVVGGNLLMRRVDELIVDLVGDVCAQVNKLSCEFASHRCAYPGLPNIALSILKELLRCTAPEAKPTRAISPLLKCMHCATDIRVIAERDRITSRHVRISIISYQDFGGKEMLSSSPQAELFNTTLTSNIYIQEATQRNLEILWSGLTTNLAEPNTAAGPLEHDSSSVEKAPEWLQNWPAVQEARLRELYRETFRGHITNQHLC
ncbi:hypothetical protein PMZ80_008686 [Knufia obscura]|uniref:Uncharacterized protein n=1 Tax=Knufia obscura TaxID=1635080 RepID=A0ABR0RGK8_9EURO|nr:hypothetical protein PMZ80_008686 [Knufia obscura]